MNSFVIVLFSGQGAQKVGMGLDYYEQEPTAKPYFDKAREILGEEFIKVLFEGPAEELTRTSYCQPALYLHGYVTLQLLKEKFPELKIVGAAGLSLGEFTAHAAAGTFTFEQGLRIVAKRGALMEAACLNTAGAMAAMIGGEVEAIEALAKECGVDVANYNAPGQIVLSGTKEGITQAVGLAKERGVRMAKELQVAGAYHSQLMLSAQEGLAKVLAEESIAEPQIPVISNFSTEKPITAEAIKNNLVNQVTGSVRWSQSMLKLIEEGQQNFIELGPGKVITGLMSRTNKTVEIKAIEALSDFDQMS